MKVHFFMSGFCSADNSHTYLKAPKGKTTFPAFWALLQHPELGNILFDTGYSEHFFTATKFFPNRIYRWIAPVTFQNNKSAKTQLLTDFGIKAEEVNYIIISHFHGDHIGGLRDFTNAQFICTKKAYQHFEKFPKFIAFSKGYLKHLLPADFNQRCLFIEDEFEKKNGDLFSENWFWKEAGICFINLPGHARGQIGIQFYSDGGSGKGPFFLVADAAWCIQNIVKNIPPPPIIKLFIDDYTALKKTIQSLTDFHKLNPDTKLIISHCKETLSNYIPQLQSKHV